MIPKSRPVPREVLTPGDLGRQAAYDRNARALVAR